MRGIILQLLATGRPPNVTLGAVRIIGGQWQISMPPATDADSIFYQPSK